MADLAPEKLRKQLDEYKQKKEIEDQQKSRLPYKDIVIVCIMLSIGSSSIFWGIFLPIAFDINGIGLFPIVAGVALFILSLFKISRMEIELEEAKTLGPMIFSFIVLPIMISLIIIEALEFGISFKAIALLIVVLVMCANGILHLWKRKKNNNL